MERTISSNGIALIKSFEGVRLTAYKATASEQYYTIGYGHYGSDVKQGMTITLEQAEEYLKADLAKFEARVNNYESVYNWTQNEFDAMVSFAYNVGSINGLTQNGTRSKDTIAEKMLLYVKSGGVVLSGLQKRREKERTLFLTADGGEATTTETEETTIAVDCYPIPDYTGNSLIDALKAAGETDTSIAHRKQIAFVNGTVSTASSYTGTSAQNKKLLALLLAGTLKRA